MFLLLLCFYEVSNINVVKEAIISSVVGKVSEGGGAGARRAAPCESVLLEALAKHSMSECVD